MIRVKKLPLRLVERASEPVLPIAGMRATPGLSARVQSEHFLNEAVPILVERARRPVLRGYFAVRIGQIPPSAKRRGFFSLSIESRKNNKLTDLFVASRDAVPRFPSVLSKSNCFNLEFQNLAIRLKVASWKRNRNANG